MTESWTDLTRAYSIWDDQCIRGFFGYGDHEYGWLSNFYSSSVYFRGQLYPSSENAYQAAKVEVYHREYFTHCSASKSKSLWKNDDLDKIYTPEEWDKVKYDIMLEIVFLKFIQNPELRTKLNNTGIKYLEETNHWKDVYWGVDYKTRKGDNNLGYILMKVRECLRKNNQFYDFGLQ